MDSKKAVWLGMVVGSFIGGLIPMAWGAGELSFSSIILTAVGGIVGFKMSH